MSLSDLAAFGSFISGLAVLISLIFLYFQLRQVSAQVTQTERNQRALMNQGVVTRNVDIMMFLAVPENRAITLKATNNANEPSADDLNFLTLAQRMNLISVQDVYVQHRQGLVDQITFDNSMGVLRNIMSGPVQRAIWRTSRTTYAPEWRSFVDKFIEEAPLATPLDRVAQFKAELAEVMR